MNNLPKDEGKPYVHQDWPKWIEGPNGQGASFNSDAEVPAGWGGKFKPTSAPVATVPVTPVVSVAPASETSGTAPGSNEGENGSHSDGADKDSAGVAWNPDIHAATKTKTNKGLWRLAVGKSRPEGQDVPVSLDL